LRIQMRRRIFVASVTALMCCAEGAASPLLAQDAPYPNNNIPVTLSSGTVVRIRNVVVFRGQNGNGLTLFIETPTPATELERVAAEAREVLKFQFKSPSNESPAMVSIGVCRTQACLEMRERPREMFSFVRQPDGSWRAEKVPDSH
jgi:hypothetical protein